MPDGDDKQAGGVGDPVHCRSCGCPLVCFIHPTDGFRLVCCCPDTAVDLGPATSESHLFTPPTGKWCPLDDSQRRTQND